MLKLENITPHTLDIFPEPLYGEPQAIASSAEELGLLRADEPCVEKLGSIMLGRSVIPVGEITYGEAIDVPRYDPDTYYVTSKLSIAAVLRIPGLELLMPRLLYPFGAVYDTQTGQCLGAKGLASPVFKPNIAQFSGHMPNSALVEENLDNTCPYPFRVYDQMMPDVVTSDDPPTYTMPASVRPLKIRYGEAPYLAELSEQLGVPVFRPEVTGVDNDGVSERLQLCHLDVPQAMGNAAMHLIGGDLVRSSETAQMCGFRALNRIAPHHFDEPVF
jgi:hypothetical protein